MNRLRRYLRRAGLALGGLLGLLLLALGLAWALLQSQAGRDWLVAQIEAEVSTPGGLTLSIERLEAGLPQSLQVRGLRLGDGQGVWLELASLDLAWRPWRLLDGVAWIETLTVKDLTVLRAPQLPPPADSAAPEEFALPRLPLRIVLEQLSVDEVRLAAPVLGQAAAFRIDGRLRSRDSDALGLELRAERSDGTPGRLTADASYRLAAGHLTLDLVAAEPPGGVIARALALPGLPAVEARLAGAGPLADWAGRLDLALPGLASAGADLTLRQADGLAFTASGQVESQRDLPDLPWSLLAGRTDFDLAGLWQDPDRLSFSRARIENPAGRLALKGSLRLDSLESDLQLEASLVDATLVEAVVPGAAGNDLAATATLRGRPEDAQATAELTAAAFSLPDVALDRLKLTLGAEGDLLQPRLEMTAAVDRLVLAGTAFSGVTATARFQPEGPLDQGLPAGGFEAQGKVAGLPLEALPDLKGLLAPVLDWQGRGRLDLAADKLEIESLTAASGSASLSAKGALDLASGDGQATAETVFSDLAPLGALAGLESNGRGMVTATASFRGYGRAYDGTLTGRLDDLALEPPAVQALLAPWVDFAGAVTGGEGAPLTLTDLKIQSAKATVTAEATLAADLAGLDGRYQAVVPDLSILSVALGETLAGDLRLVGTAGGDPANPELAGQVTWTKGQIATFTAARLALDYQAQDLAGRTRAKIGLKGTTGYGPLEGGAVLRREGQRLAITDIELTSDATRVAGRAGLPLDGGPIGATLRAESKELGRWLALAGQAGSGRATADVELFGSEGRQDLRAKVALQQFVLGERGAEQLSIEETTAKLSLEDALGAPRGQLELTGRGLTADTLALQNFQVGAKGSSADLAFDLAGTGDWSGPLELRAKGRLGLGASETRIELTELDGRLLGQTLRSQRTARFTQEADGWQLVDLDLRFGDASLQGAGRQGKAVLALDLSVRALDLATLRPLLPLEGVAGQLEGRVTLAGTPAKPRGTLSAQVAELVLADLEQDRPASLTVTGDWAAGRLKLDGRLADLAERPALLAANLPLRLDAATWVVSLPEREPISGQVQWQGELAELWPLVPLVNHDLKGEGALDLTLKGTPARPAVEGRITLEKGRYENFQTGTLLRDLSLLVNLQGSKAVIKSLKATDSHKGKLQALGQVDLDPDRGFPFNATLQMKNFQAVRRDDVSGSGDAKLTFAGSQEAARLSGRLETRRVEIRIPDRLPGEIVELKVVEAGTEPAEGAEPGGEEPAGAGGEIALDMDLVLPNQVFLRGRGLDSEWAGRIAVGGTAAQPRLKGKLQLVRGEISILAKTFALQSGTVDLLGGPEIDPLLAVKAVNQGPDLTVTIEVTGPLSDPEILLSSSPVLPQDEIVARLLFGRSTTKLSALEAVQLAAAVGELTGQTGGPGILDFTRDTLGVDVLKVEGGEGGPAVSAGKYLRRDVYVGVKQGTTADSGAVEVEVEVTPNISIESEVGQTGDSNVGIKFKWDY